ncbi:hypothetical protein OAO87_02025, partial [bacterium]|nr:hypothetical protein [bacterium]
MDAALVVPFSSPSKLRLVARLNLPSFHIAPRVYFDNISFTAALAPRPRLDAGSRALLSQAVPECTRVELDTTSIDSETIWSLELFAQLQIQLPRGSSSTEPEPVFDLIGRWEQGRGVLLQFGLNAPWTSPFGLRWLQLQDMVGRVELADGGLTHAVIEANASLICPGSFSLQLGASLSVSKNAQNYSTILDVRNLPNLHMFAAFGICMI